MDLEKLSNFIIETQPKPNTKSVRVLYEKNFNHHTSKKSYQITVVTYTSAGVRSQVWSTGDLPTMGAAINYTTQHFATPHFARMFWGK